MIQGRTLDPAAATRPDWSPITRRLDLDALFSVFAEGAAARDVARRPIVAETAALKARGFGAVRLSREAGGAGVSLPELFALARDLASADPNIAHVFRNHFFAIEQHRKTPDAPFSARILALAGEGRMFGNAVSEAGGGPAGSRNQVPGARLTRDGNGYRVSGRKIYSTGNLYADHLFASALDETSGRTVQFLVSTKAPGVTLDDDWTGFGQKLTGSGTTVFEDVAVSPGDLFALPERAEGGPHLYGFTFHQVYLTVVISGIVTRILQDALALVRGRSRNYYHALAEHPSHEPEIQAVIGRIAAHRAAILAVTDRAVDALDRAWARAAEPDAEALSIAASIAAAEAKIVTDEVAATLASLLLDVGSGSAVATERALDRHWRNLKVIAAHNPRIYKERVVGDHYLNGALPPTGAFF
ncbi:acyl-CoA dehydrogenase family protein [Methylobacterium indicum]|uniref:Dibenzothiophene monooxygenase n=1 Tax=Methylobacterium indicum TaxID=1775910 RepID=A0A8H8WSX7_9HYPH|nr:acyl-CoA dehydrogenase family protein [Methylobacterium indicum]BCM83860.1 putative acyl-CoA dehydrogenase [Methylobacterium indicum]